MHCGKVKAQTKDLLVCANDALNHVTMRNTMVDFNKNTQASSIARDILSFPKTFFILFKDCYIIKIR